MTMKSKVLVVSIAYTAFFTVLFLLSEYCSSAWCRIHDDDPLGLVFFLLLPLLPTFFLSLITYRMKDEVFLAWWRFARWWVLVIIGVTLFLQNAGGGGGWGMNGGAFDAFFLGIFYVILIVASLVKIFNAYLKTKQTQ